MPFDPEGRGKLSQRDMARLVAGIKRQIFDTDRPHANWLQNRLDRRRRVCAPCVHKKDAPERGR